MEGRGAGSGGAGAGRGRGRGGGGAGEGWGRGRGRGRGWQGAGRERGGRRDATRALLPLPRGQVKREDFRGAGFSPGPGTPSVPGGLQSLSEPFAKRAVSGARCSGGPGTRQARRLLAAPRASWSGTRTRRPLQGPANSPTVTVLGPRPGESLVLGSVRSPWRDAEATPDPRPARPVSERAVLNSHVGKGTSPRSWVPPET